MSDRYYEIMMVFNPVIIDGNSVRPENGFRLVVRNLNKFVPDTIEGVTHWHHAFIGAPADIGRIVEVREIDPVDYGEEVKCQLDFQLAVVDFLRKMFVALRDAKSLHPDENHETVEKMKTLNALIEKGCLGLQSLEDLISAQLSVCMHSYMRFKDQGGNTVRPKKKAA